MGPLLAAVGAPRLTVQPCLSVLLVAAAVSGIAASSGSVGGAIAQVIEAASAKSCGVAGVLSADGRYEPPHDILQLQCGTMMTTNCSVSYRPMKCPKGCEYLAPSTAFSCLFQCVRAERCSETNPNRAYPHPETNICMPCGIAGCKLCESQSRCAKCHSKFELAHGGTKCAFSLRKRMHLGFVLTVLAVLLGLLVLLAVLWAAVKGPHPQWEQNMVSIMRARRHRHLSKVQEWRLGDTKQVRRWYSLATNMHRTNVLGVGVPLFYNSICFLVLISLLFLTVTYAVYRSHAVSGALGKFEHTKAMLESSAVRPPGQTPAIVMSPLASCSEETAGDILRTLRDFAGWNFYAVGFLYVATFALSLAFGGFQKRFAADFDAKHLSMSDYAVRLTGLPKDETDEAALRKWVEDEFRAACPGEFRRPAEHIRTAEVDGSRPRSDTRVEVSAVSICYDYGDQRDAVDDVMWKLMEHMEVDMHTRAQSDPWELGGKNTTAAYRNISLPEEEAENREKALAWFEGEKKLRGCGEAFVVFRYISDKEAIMRHSASEPDFLRHPRAPLGAVKLFPVFSEPPAVAWWFAGLSDGTVVKRTVRNVLYIVLLIAAVQVFVILPYAWFILWPFSHTGRVAGGMIMTVAGVLLGNINGILFMTNYNTAARVGYHRKDELDEFVLFANTLLVLVNTALNIFTTAYMVIRENDASYGLSGFLEVRYLKAIGTENALAMNVYNMMMPGSFFTGLVMAMIMAGWVPFVVNTLLMKLIYIWKCLPDCLLRILKAFLPWAPPGLDHYPFRSAEKAFDPWEVPICGNYADHIVTPTICFCMLFCLSPYVWRTFLGMLMWTCFEYIFFRFMHLRYHKACYYTTHRLDAFALFLWGLPLSVLAAAWCLWGLRSGHLLPGTKSVALRFMTVVGAFLASGLLWLVCFHFFVRPFRADDATEENNDRTVEEVMAETVYSWLNCNPPYVLKCQYYFKDEGGNFVEERRKGHPIACGEDPEEVRFFEVGKQYLFVKPMRQALVNQDTHNIFEYETHFERALDLFGGFVSLFRKRGLGKLNRTRDTTTYNLLETSVYR